MKVSRTIVYALLVAGAAALIGLAWPDLVGRAAYALQKGQAVAAREQLQRARDLSLAFQEVVKAAQPSVVSIRSIKKVEGPAVLRGPQLGPGDPFRDFFGDDFFQRFFGGRIPQTPEGNELFQSGVGTGVIVSRDGYILTNNHVAGGADRITVTLSDNRQFDAKVVGTDAQTDLAVLKIDADKLLPAELGDSDAIEVGEWVLAVGSPFGLSHTVTAGIISAKGRANVGITDYEDFIQTDAAINPGNSGGPLVNLDGKVIGINTAIATRTGSYQGIGFAIPTNMARQVMDSIIKQGKVVRGWLGVAIQNLTEDLAQSFGYEGTDGALVGDVTAGGPAAEAGVKPGDIIVRFDGKKVEDMNKLRNTVAATAPGREIQVELFRDRKPLTVTIKVGELPSQRVAARAGEPTEDLGLTVQDLSRELAQQLRVEADRGVVVTKVEPGGLAERGGLVAGDLILEVDGRPVDSVNGFYAALRERDIKDGVRLRVKTQGMQRFVFLKKR